MAGVQTQRVRRGSMRGPRSPTVSPAFIFLLNSCFADSAMAAQVLVIDNGGREHTLAWKLAQSTHVKQVLVTPGNAGTACSEKISNTDISVSDHTALAQFCKDEKTEFIVVGPEAPLAAGIVGNLNSVGVRCFGPTAEAAQLEFSKRFAKEFMDRHGIPTARWRAFIKTKEACDFHYEVDRRQPVKGGCLVILLPYWNVRVTVTSL